MHFVRDVRYARDVPSGVSGGTHYITATRREQHHYAARHNITCAKGAHIIYTKGELSTKALLINMRDQINLILRRTCAS